MEVSSGGTIQPSAEDSASTEKEASNIHAPMEGVEEQEESEDEWAVFDELDQTIDAVTNNAKQQTKPTLEKDINNSSSPPLQSVSEKTDEKTLPHTSQTSQEKSLTPPPPTSTLAGESSLSGDTADECDSTADMVVGECSDTLGVGDLT